jgi:transposase-like protein
MERRRTFSREFKLEAVKVVTERGPGGQGPGRSRQRAAQVGS